MNTETSEIRATIEQIDAELRASAARMDYLNKNNQRPLGDAIEDVRRLLQAEPDSPDIERGRISARMANLDRAKRMALLALEAAQRGHSQDVIRSAAGETERLRGVVMQAAEVLADALEACDKHHDLLVSKGADLWPSPSTIGPRGPTAADLRRVVAEERHHFKRQELQSRQPTGKTARVRVLCGFDVHKPNDVVDLPEEVAALKVHERQAEWSRELPRKAVTNRVQDGVFS